MMEIRNVGGLPVPDEMVLNQVAFEVAGNIVLKPLSFSFRAQAVTGLIGQMAAGKSTLLKILARHQSPTAGNISFGGRPIQAWSEREFARKVAYLPQYTPLAAGLKVRELVALGRYPWHGAFGRFGRADHERVDEALTLTSTESVADRLVDTLSGGERQRVWLAMCLRGARRCFSTSPSRRSISLIKSESWDLCTA